MSDTLAVDPYKTLGVGKDANVNDVKKAYRKLVLTCHPDKTGTLPEVMKKEKDDQFHQVQQAHDLLTNPVERQRYDERVQLEELRSELRRDLGREGPPTPSFKASYIHKQPRSAPNKTPAKSPTTPIFETRGTPIYETRVPKGVFDEDYPGGRYDSPRGSSRKHEDRFPDAPPANPRRASGRMPDRIPDDARRPSSRREDDDDYFSRKAQTKDIRAEQRAGYQDRKKSRTKTRRFESETKRQAFAESDSDDSEVERFMGASPRDSDTRRRSDEPLRRTRTDERPSRRTRSPSSDSADDSRLQFAKNHMRSNGTRYPDPNETFEKRPSLFKNRSSRTTPPPPPVPTAPSVPAPIDTEKARRSSARRTTSSKSKRNPEIVDASKDFHDDYTFELPRRSKKDDMPSSPRNLVSSPRSKTFTPERPGDGTPSIRRTQTAPLSGNSITGRPSRSSNLKYATTPTMNDEEDTEDSSAASPHETPQSARYTSKKYRVKEDSDTDSDPHKPRIMTVELDDAAPKSAPPRSSRPPLSATAPAASSGPSYVEAVPRSYRHRSDIRTPPRRSNTLDLGISSNNKSSSKSRHHHSSSNDAGVASSGRLFGEVSNESPFSPPGDVSYSPRYGREDIQFTEGRRGSADEILGGIRERDKERERSRDKERDRDRSHRDSHRRGDREHGKDEYAYETSRSARRAADGRPGISGRGGSYQSVRV